MKKVFISNLLIIIFFIQSIKTDLYVDSTIKYAKYEDFSRDAQAGYMAIGNMEGLDVQVVDGAAILTTKEI